MVPAQVEALAEGMLKTMLLKKLTKGMTALLVLSVSTVGWVVANQPSAAPLPPIDPARTQELESLKWYPETNRMGKFSVLFQEVDSVETLSEQGTGLAPWPQALGRAYV